MKQMKSAILVLMCALATLFGGVQIAFAADAGALHASEIGAVGAVGVSDDSAEYDVPAPTNLRSLKLVIYEAYSFDEYGFTCTYSMNRHVYSGKAIKPKPAVRVDEYSNAEYGPDQLPRLKNGVDYKLSYKNNVSPGVAKVVITGINGYCGTVSKSFRICALVKNAKVAKVAPKTFRGTAFKPTPKVTYKGKALKRGTDYTLSYKNNVKAGRAAIIVKGKGRFAGTKVAYFRINKRSLKKAAIAKVAKKTYTGKLIKPRPKVTVNGKTLKNGTDYTLSYAKNRQPGIAKIIIKGKGNYKGKRAIKFRIVKPAPAPAAAPAPAPAPSPSSSYASTSTYYSSAGPTVYITNTGAKYHRENCRWLYASKIPISMGDAVSQGYEPCKVCNP